MSERKVAARYAKALIDLSVEQKNLDVILGDMKDFVSTLKHNHQIVTMLKSPVVKGDNKMAVLNKIFGKTYHKNTMGFFGIIIRKNRASFLLPIAEVFVEQYNELNNIMLASVKTAQPIDQKLTDEIKQFISSYTGKTIELKSTVDPELIGGMVIQMGDKLFDASIQGKLNKLKHELINTYISK